ncbi:NAD(P)H-binding protein [Streptomonospora nanhaiensis]|uniref:Uncharacterized protein YbjT (DUF2867 family) n=1 Tax=Streptomonospora nanhaiensis TaxID=1323731 RepID=A0A853BKS4_9ACTN|nr:NAD(P)H-binding protein [Streptomonospora nanhaiensis]MBV2362948.1 NAD(P)H-binding protein [Streptomonospora nanhaiensis]MBX9388953.1 NAD(P)H-binding protein [Streptomonospora nanhaiensis]NYI95314.1 uncharacterized protein YbjT (DUF2867 family) [Streptomonospora nanhaiensis]
MPPSRSAARSALRAAAGSTASARPVLVTGAAGGSPGATGGLVTRLLLERGVPVRALVRADDHRAAALRRAGAEVAVADLREVGDLLPALRGVRRAFFTYPVAAGLLDAAAAFAEAAAAGGLDRVVAVSQLAASPQAPAPHARRHWLAERVLDRAGLNPVHLRAGVLFEDLAVVLAAGDERRLALPLGSPCTVLPLVAAADVARVAAALLADPTADPGSIPDPDPVCLLTGQVSSVAEIVTAFDSAAAHGVSYTDLPEDRWERQAHLLYRDPVAVEHLRHLWESFRRVGSRREPYPVTDDIQRYGGAPPTTLAEFARARARAAEFATAV